MKSIQNAIKNMGAEFRVIDGPTTHPDALSDSEIDERVIEIFNNRIENIQELPNLNDLLTGQGGIVYLAYDSEWVNKGGQLKCLSYQFYFIGEVGELAAIFFPKSGHHDDRFGLSDMLPALFAKALETGCILDYPSQVVLIGFFLRADLAMFRDLVEYKTELGNVGGKIATTKRPVEFQLLYSRKDILKLMDSTVVCCG